MNYQSVSHNRSADFQPRTAAEACNGRGPTREGSLEFELGLCQKTAAELGEALQELRGRIGPVMRDIPRAQSSGPLDVPPGPEQCTYAANAKVTRATLDRLIAGVKEMLELLDLN